DEALDLTGGKPQHGLRGRGRGEQAVGGGTGGRVLRAKRQDAGDQDAERVAIALRDDGERGRVLAGRAPPEPANHGTDRYSLTLIDSRSGRSRGTSFTAQSAMLMGVVSFMTPWGLHRAEAYP